jgi:energy-coupling factor transporter ATP-binding protein EcfA2
MANFDFSTLNSHDFELLVRDLLNADEDSKGSGIRFRTFKEGKDKGIDLLYSTNSNEYEIVGQAKHYLQSGIDKLIYDLKNVEADKVRKLDPAKYIFATSLPLLVSKSGEILSIFNPYIKNSSDIYGQEELNRLLDKHPHVLNNHFKLWLSSAAILTKVLDYKLEGRSQEFSENELKKKLRLYVETPALEAARSILKKNKFIVITGEPGVGKTTTAELLLYEAIADGYNLVYVYDDVKEMESDLALKDNKTVYYYDDFLGHNALEIAKAKGAETALLRIIKRVIDSKTKLLIFTTRTFILNSAVEESERLRQFDLKAKQSLIELKSYSKSTRLQLLDNHIEESLLSDELKAVLKQSDVQAFIVNHQNFYPRSVEFITMSDKAEDMSAADFKKFIYSNFNKPDEIWRHAYEQQISENERMLLNTMVSFGYDVHIDVLEEAFNARVDYEVKHNNYRKKINLFIDSFRRLEGGFITNSRYDSEMYGFINYSLVDFLVTYIRSDNYEAMRIAEAATFVEQLTTRLYPLSEPRQTKTMSDRLKARLLTDTASFIKEDSGDADRLALFMLLITYFSRSENHKVAKKLLSSILQWDFLGEDTSVSIPFVSWLRTASQPELIDIITNRSTEVFVPLILNASELDECVSLLDLATSEYDFDLSLDAERLQEVTDHLNNLLDEKIESDIEELLDYSHAQDFVDEKESDSMNTKNILESFGFDIRANLARYGEHDWYEVGMDNYFREQMAKDD